MFGSLKIITRVLSTLFLLLVTMVVNAQSDLDYLPKSMTYNEAIPLPQDELGSAVGTWHVRHDQLVSYMRRLAQASDRVSVIETGRTHENRPLLLLAISTAENQRNLQQIQAKHLENIQSGRKPKADDPMVLWMGYSVHGNEPSGSNASMLVAYYLAAGQGKQVTDLLQNSVVLIDPSINPDGLSRFAQWANMYKSQNLVADPNSREHAQGWPSARTNHYWFDLNRDWLLLTHPESQARIAQYHQWRPNVLTDFHEMGTNSTYFFQPGIASRKNPNTSAQNVKLTEALAQFHAKAFDRNKVLYFTQESFDDFYYGKGSTYPDALGSIGILFEQASSRGHLQDSINGPLAFADTIQNQVTTSLSTFEGAMANKSALQQYQTEFKHDTEALIKDDDLRGFLLSEAKDRTRFNRLKSILSQHHVAFFGLAKTAEVEDRVYASENSIFVPLDQPNYRLIKSLFSTRKRFLDNTFYDVSNWNLPLAFNIQYDQVQKKLFSRLSLSEQSSTEKSLQLPPVQEQAYAYGFAWDDYNAPALLQRLLSKKVQVRIAQSPFSAATSAGTISFPAGSVIIPTGLTQPDNLSGLLHDLSEQKSVQIWSINSGLTQQGIDFGSRNMLAVKAPKVMIVGGAGTSQYEVGEAWHYLDTRVDMPASVVELANLPNIDLSDYTHMIWVAGKYSNTSEELVKAIEQWLTNGGVLIGQTSAAKWFAKNKWLKTTFLSTDEVDSEFKQKGLAFGDREALSAKKRIAGAAFATTLDTTHPLAFGYQSPLLPVFRNHQHVMLMPEKAFVTAAQYTADPLLAGYAADELQGLIGDSAAVVAHRFGKGRVIAFADNPNFRGYWYGTSRLLSNAIFMAGFIDVQG